MRRNDEVEAQRRRWTFYETIKFKMVKIPPQMNLKKAFYFFCCVFFLFLLPLFSPALTIAQEAKLAWDPPVPATGILGYRVYIGTSPGQYTNVVDAGNQTEVPLSSLNITPGITYYIAVKSYNSTQESPEFSNEINTDFLLVSTQSGTLITETQGGPFQSSLSFSLRNLGSQMLTWRATLQQNWLSLSSPEGSLGPNQTIDITASINDAAVSFVPGDYDGSIIFENSTNSQGNISVEVTLRVVSSGVTPPPVVPPPVVPPPVVPPPVVPPPVVPPPVVPPPVVPPPVVPPPVVPPPVVPPVETGPGNLYAVAETKAALTEIVGGPFSASVNFIVKNIGGESLTWAAYTQRWVKLSSTGGELKSGETARIAASIDSLAASFHTGTYYASILFQNETNGEQSTSLPLVLRIDSAPEPEPEPEKISQIIGIFRKEAGFGFWYLDNNGNGHWDRCSSDGCLGPFGGFPGDVPLVGSWDGKGKKIGIFRQGRWFFDYNGNGAWDECGLDFCIEEFGGTPGDIPVVGDWSGEGITQIGLYRNGSWVLDNGNGILEECGVDSCLGPFGGYPGDVPVVGDWTGDGSSKIGIYRNGKWFLDANGNGEWDGCEIDRCLEGFGGNTGDIPVAGDWTGNGMTKIGVYRNGTWYLDYNGNGIWDGCETGQPDRCYPVFGGMIGDLPVVF